MTAIDTLISDLQGGKYSDLDQNLIAKVANMVAALQYIASGLSPAGPEAANAFLGGPLSGAPALPTYRAIDPLDLNTPLGAGGVLAILLAAAGQYGWNGRAQMVSGADGIITLLNNALGDFTRLNLGGTSASFPALQRNAAALQAELADGSGLANFILNQLQPSQTAGILGTTTNNNANAGSVGEYVTASATLGGVLNAAGAPSNVTSISLTAGDWDTSADCIYVDSGAALVFTRLNLGISTVSATLGTNGTSNAAQIAGGAASIAADNSLHVGPHRLSLAGTTTVYCVAAAVYALGNLTPTAQIRARRVR